MKNNEHGRSMIEMLGVLAIIGVLSLAALAGYQKAMAKHKLNRTMQQMVTIVNNLRTTFYQSQDAKTPYNLFGNNKSASVEGMRKAVQLRVFPDEMIFDANAPVVQNLYKGDVYIISEDGGETFEVVFEALPKEASIAIGTIDWGTDDASGLQEVLINEGEESAGGE